MIGSLKILGGRFEILPQPVVRGWRVRVYVTAQNIMRAARLFRARVGNQPVLGLVPYPFGEGFEGYLEAIPRPGDRLYVGYSTPNIPTHVVFGESSTPPVA